MSAGLTATTMKDCRLLKPVLIAQIAFLEWTGENHLRHTAFMALRDDTATQGAAGIVAPVRMQQFSRPFDTGSWYALAKLGNDVHALTEFHGVLDGGAACGVIEHTPDLLRCCDPADGRSECCDRVLVIA